jgi:hypothetical protein
MKTQPLKSVTMKSDLKTTPYFSAYPLKAIKAPGAAAENNNHQPSKKVISRLRILPMVNPYPEKRVASINKIKLRDDIPPPDANWFNNYE